MVVISCPTAALTGITHERLGDPARCTVQAPHSATPQPNFVPFMPSKSRRTHKSGMSGSASTLCDFPLILRVTIALPPRPSRLICSSGSLLFGQYLSVRFSVRIEAGLVALRPGSSLLGATDVPIGTAALQHGAQVEAQLLRRRPAEEPVPLVDLVDSQPGLEHQGVRDHRIVVRVGVLRDVEILLQLAAGVREERPGGAAPGAE